MQPEKGLSTLSAKIRSKPNPELSYSNQMRSVLGTAQSTNDAPTFTERGTVTGHLTTVLQKAGRAGLSLCTYTEKASLWRQRGSRARERPHPKAVRWTKPFSVQIAVADGCPPREASRGISALPTERQLTIHKLSPTLQLRSGNEPEQSSVLLRPHRSQDPS